MTRRPPPWTGEDTDARLERAMKISVSSLAARVDARILDEDDIEHADWRRGKVLFRYSRADSRPIRLRYSAARVTVNRRAIDANIRSSFGSRLTPVGYMQPWSASASTMAVSRAHDG